MHQVPGSPPSATPVGVLGGLALDTAANYGDSERRLGAARAAMLAAGLAPLEAPPCHARRSLLAQRASDRRHTA